MEMRAQTVMELSTGAVGARVVSGGKGGRKTEKSGNAPVQSFIVNSNSLSQEAQVQILAPPFHEPLNASQATPPSPAAPTGFRRRW